MLGEVYELRLKSYRERNGYEGCWSMTRHRSVVLGLTLVASFVAALATMMLAMLVHKEAKTQPVQPNFVFIYTDDMRKDELQYMPHLKSLIKDPGMTFSNEYVPQ